MASERIIWFEELSSTNETARQYLNKQSGFCIASGFQNSGRGQTGNSWVSDPDKNLLASYIFDVEMKPSESFAISMITSLAVVSFLNSYNCSAKIKWPNDIIVDDKKIAGILIENIITGDMIEKSIIGIGLNLNQTEFAGLSKATSLKSILKTNFEIESIATELQRHLTVWFEGNKKPSQAIKNSYFDLLYMKENAEYKDDNTSFKGKIVDVDFDGALNIQKDNGDLKRYYFKQIQMVY